MKKIFSDTALLHTTVRIGKGRKPIVISKLRTMKRNAHHEYDTLFANGHFIGKLGVRDKRITRIGRFLRTTNLDELPQIMNFLKGELSLVGMRPLTRQDYRRLPPDIKQIYDEIGPALAGIQYAYDGDAPRQTERHYDEYRKFYRMWKKNRALANLTYVLRIIKNRLQGKGWSA